MSGTTLSRVASPTATSGWMMPECLRWEDDMDDDGHNYTHGGFYFPDEIEANDDITSLAGVTATGDVTIDDAEGEFRYATPGARPPDIPSCPFVKSDDYRATILSTPPFPVPINIRYSSTGIQPGCIVICGFTTPPSHTRWTQWGFKLDGAAQMVKVYKPL